MAAFVRTKLVNNYRNLDRDAAQHMFDAMAGGSSDAVKSRNQVLGRPDFIVEGTTDSNTAVLNSNNPQSYLLNLTTEGLVEFPAGYERDITIECWTEDESGPNYQKILQTVRNTAGTLSLTNGVRNIGPPVGARYSFANSGTDIAVADSWGGAFAVTTDEVATGRFAGTVPKARRLLVKSLSVAIVGTGSLAAAGCEGHLNALTLATGVVELGIRNGAGANVAPADTMQLHADLDLLPIESPELAIATGPTPDNVLVGALGQANENVVWKAHIWVGDLRSITAATASE